MQENELLQVFKPLHFLCYVFGLLSFVTKKGNSCFLVNVIKALVLPAMHLFHFGFLVGSFPYDVDYYRKWLSVIQVISSLLLSTAESALGTYFSSEIYDLFELLQSIDTALTASNFQISYKKCRRQVRWSIFVILVLIITIVLITSASIELDYWVAFFLLFLFFMPYLATAFVQMQYILYMKHIRSRMQMLNEYMDSIGNNVIKANNAWNIFQNLIVEEPTYTFNTENVRPIVGLNFVIVFHSKLLKASKIVSRVFNVQILFMLTVCFVGTISAIFFILLNTTLIPSTTLVTENLTYLVWAVSNAGEVLGFVLATSALYEEANKLVRILLKLRNNTNNDALLEDRIDVFSLQLFHNRLRFYVCGLFPLDNTLLHTIVAGVTTYLVILVQFNVKNFTRTQMANNTSNQILT